MLTRWFKQRGWIPFSFQLETWKAFLDGRSGLVHSPTGTGKTYAVWGGPLLEYLQNPSGQKVEPLRVLWITPLRALANDTVESLRAPVKDMNLPWTVEMRTGDTSSSQRAKQRERMPTALVTTPESLSLLLSYNDAREKLSTLRCIIVDEWHDLLGTKRGVQTELCLARLRNWYPELRTWGLSATLGNLEQANEVLHGNAKGLLISGDLKKEVQVKTLLPITLEKFPWAGHVGLTLLADVLRHLESARTTLLFTNTRSQTEIWFRALEQAKPEWANEIAIHHGSVDREARNQVEENLRLGKLRCVVCTASLDLGVDFTPVEQVIQIGAPKGVARILQRAGRSGHQPGAISRIICVPAHALELVEFSAVREAIAKRELEARLPIERPLDVLTQHLVTSAMGGGFKAGEMLHEVRTTYAYRNLTPAEWEWCLDFVTRGGQALQVYPQFARVKRDGDEFSVENEIIARLHRMSIGTITSDTAMIVKAVRGGTLGSVEESFIARLKPGDRFSFSGQQLELVRVRDMTAYVRRCKKASSTVPQWMGGKMPLSTQLARAVRKRLQEAKNGIFVDAEMKTAADILEIQNSWSRIPEPDEILIEQLTIRGGTHHFIYPFAGRLVHEGLAPLIAYRMGKIQPATLSVVINDYGFGLLTESSQTLTETQWQNLFSADHLLEDLLACLNASELARRQFREIARIAGLVFQGYPGQSKTARQLQASSGLFFEVFQKYDPENLLLSQARSEVLERQLEISRLRETLDASKGMKVVLVQPKRLTPLSFPLWASFVQANVSTERWIDRVRQMAEQLEKAAAKP